MTSRPPFAAIDLRVIWRTTDSVSRNFHHESLHLGIISFVALPSARINSPRQSETGRRILKRNAPLVVTDHLLSLPNFESKDPSVPCSAFSRRKRINSRPLVLGEHPVPGRGAADP